MSIPLFYWKGHSNFGDELSPYLVQKICGAPCFYQRPSFSNSTLLGIGSILRPTNLGMTNVIWGSGTLTSRVFPKKRSIKIFPLKRVINQILLFTKATIDIRAVRGPKTKALLEGFGFHCPAIYGDPAILLPRYYTPRKKKQTFKVGLILHLSQKLSLSTADLLDAGILPIPVLREGNAQIESFIDEVCSCQMILSSSLHGIIVAQSYGIPAQWIQIKEQPIQNDDTHKFEDYFLGAGQTVQSPLKLNLSSLSIKSLCQIRPPRVLPFACADALLNAFPFDFIEHLEHQDRHKHA